jgi:A/G-specific adenine glycosylase
MHRSDIINKYYELSHLKDYFSKEVILWFVKNKRKLPWRTKISQDNFSYLVLVSEFMLQQTQVKTVIPYFQRFIAKWPSVQSLAQTNDKEILIFWQGLGYYSRGRNLLKSAKIIVSDYDGNIPVKEKELKKLPGVGNYTAAAIRSIAFNKKAVAIDGNVKRVIARFFGLEGTLESNLDTIQKIADLICPSLNNRNYTQGVMELGAIICKPMKPDCSQCIISKHCIAFSSYKTDSIPLPRKRLQKKKLKCVTYLAIKNNKSVLLIQRKDKNILKDQWELPSTDWKKEETYEINLNSPLKNTKWKKSEVNFNHSFTHIDLFNSIYISRLGKDSSKLEKVSKSRWISLQDLDNYPLTTMSKKTLEMHDLI